jgi:serine/threonine protein kinase
MARADPAQTQRPDADSVVAELAGAGFADVTLIGKGGFGAVYRCIETSLDRTVAIKILRPNHNEKDLTRFVREQEDALARVGAGAVAKISGLRRTVSRHSQGLRDRRRFVHSGGGCSSRISMMLVAPSIV